MNTPRINRSLFFAYGIISITVFILALIFPQVRNLSYAPLREAILPPPDPIVVSILYSTEKEAWLTDMVNQYAADSPTYQGHPIKIDLEKMGSWEINNAVIDGDRQPIIISPASSLQVAALQDASNAQFGTSLVKPADESLCYTIVKTPLVIVAWKERADNLWGQQPGPALWQDIHQALLNPAGWAAYQQPDWGYVKFAHTDPLKSNSGFMTILMMTYAYYDKTSGLTSSDILTDTGFQDWFIKSENSVGKFEYSTGPLMQKMITYGPSAYDMITVYEATAIEQAENAVGRYGELRIYYPPALLWSDHPFCILDADWVSPQQREAAQLFLDYLSSPQSQQSALMQYGFRPADSSIDLEQNGSPFDRYAANGLIADLNYLPELDIPNGNVLNTLRDFWTRNVQH